MKADPTPEQIEAVARALQVARGLGADTLHQHHEWEDYPADEERHYVGLDGKEVSTLMHYAWRKRVPEAVAAITALQTLDTQGEVSQGDGLADERDADFLFGLSLALSEIGKAAAAERVREISERLAALSSTDQRAEERERCAMIVFEEVGNHSVCQRIMERIRRLPPVGDEGDAQDLTPPAT